MNKNNTNIVFLLSLGCLAFLYSCVSFAASSGPFVPPVIDAFSFISPASDVSIGYLGKLFGSVGGLLAANETTIFGVIFKFFNAGILSISGVLLTYTTIRAIVDTAHEGEAMGKKMGHWTIIRTIVGVGLLVPKMNTGYTMLQSLIIWMVIQGVGLANMLWVSTLDYLNKGGVIYQGAYGTNDTASQTINPTLNIEKRYVIGVDGPNTSGKTETFEDSLAAISALRSELCLVTLRSAVDDLRERAAKARLTDPTVPVIPALTLAPTLDQYQDGPGKGEYVGTLSLPGGLSDIPSSSPNGGTSNTSYYISTTDKYQCNNWVDRKPGRPAVPGTAGHPGIPAGPDQPGYCTNSSFTVTKGKPQNIAVVPQDFYSVVAECPNKEYPQQGKVPCDKPYRKSYTETVVTTTSGNSFPLSMLNGACGVFGWQVNVRDKTQGQDRGYQLTKLAALQALLNNMEPIARKVFNDWADYAAGKSSQPSWTNSGDVFNNQVRQMLITAAGQYQGAIDYYRKWYASDYNANRSSADDEFKKFFDVAKKQGWAVAGSYYWNLAQQQTMQSNKGIDNTYDRIYTNKDNAPADVMADNLHWAPRISGAQGLTRFNNLVAMTQISTYSIPFLNSKFIADANSTGNSILNNLLKWTENPLTQVDGKDNSQLVIALTDVNQSLVNSEGSALANATVGSKVNNVRYVLEKNLIMAVLPPQSNITYENIKKIVPWNILGGIAGQLVDQGHISIDDGKNLVFYDTNMAARGAFLAWDCTMLQSKAPLPYLGLKEKLIDWATTQSQYDEINRKADTRRDLHEFACEYIWNHTHNASDAPSFYGPPGAGYPPIINCNLTINASTAECKTYQERKAAFLASKTEEERKNLEACAAPVGQHIPTAPEKFVVDDPSVQNSMCQNIYIYSPIEKLFYLGNSLLDISTGAWRTILNTLTTLAANFAALQYQYAMDATSTGLIAGAIPMTSIGAAVTVLYSVWQTVMNYYFKMIELGLSYAMPFSMAILTIMFTMGASLFFYVPLVPYVLFTLGIISWLIFVIEAMVAAPIVAIGMMDPQTTNNEILGRAEHAQTLLFSVFLRPALMLVGLIATMILLYVGLAIINVTFLNLIDKLIALSGASATGGVINGGDLFVMAKYIVMLIVYVMILITLVTKCSECIYGIPDQVLHWIGAQTRPSGDAHLLQEIKGGVDKMAGEGAQAGRGATERMGQAASQPVHVGTEQLQTGLGVGKAGIEDAKNIAAVGGAMKGAAKSAGETKVHEDQ